MPCYARVTFLPGTRLRLKSHAMGKGGGADTRLLAESEHRGGDIAAVTCDTSEEQKFLSNGTPR